MSRQVIVQDIAVLKASGNDIISTNRGYFFNRLKTFTRDVWVRHSEDRVEEELTLIVDYGGAVKNLCKKIRSQRIYLKIAEYSHLQGMIVPKRGRFNIGTENSIVEHLQFDLPEKQFYPLSVRLTCMDMRVTTLMDIYKVLIGEGGEEVILASDIMEGVRRSIDRMIELGE